MPLYLRPPRKATHSYEIRGTYLGVRVEHYSDHEDRTKSANQAHVVQLQRTQLRL